MTRVAIIGGGPGGLFSAHLLQQRCGKEYDTTLFEATERVGGKIQTRRFDGAAAIYEAGVAECYDYSMIAHDPLRQLVTELDLQTRTTTGSAVMMNGTLLRGDDDIDRLHGPATGRAIRTFRSRARAMLPLKQWQQGDWKSDNAHPWADRTGDEILNEVPNRAAREYLRVSAHSDLATELHLTSGLNALKNFLMDVPGYVGQYSIDGGMEMLPKTLGLRLTRTKVHLNCCVHRVHRRNDRYVLSHSSVNGLEQQEFDAVLVCLPHSALSRVEWCGEPLRQAMDRHIAYYNYPGHYLRISVLFRSPFWASMISDAWFMHDAFGGCCIYNESARHSAGGHGVLGWLLAGSDAVAMSNLDDATLIRRVLESLPGTLERLAREQFLEAKIHRWVAAVSGQPGGVPVRNPYEAHVPEPAQHPGLFVVGDYLFDSTLNGVLDSAAVATDLLQVRTNNRASVVAARRGTAA